MLAGFADTLAFGATRYVRKKLGYQDTVTESSTAYRAGKTAAAAAELASLAAGAPAAAKAGVAAVRVLKHSKAAAAAGKLLRDKVVRVLRAVRARFRRKARSASRSSRTPTAKPGSYVVDRPLPRDPHTGLPTGGSRYPHTQLAGC